MIPEIQASQAYQNNGLILIWFDETEGGDTSNYTIPFIAISPLAKGNAYQSTVNFTHSSDLRTMQDIFQVAGTSATGYLGAAATAYDESDLFQPNVISQLQTFLPGDFNRDGHADATDISAMEQALVDLPDYQTAKSLSNSQLLHIGDLNGDGAVNNADLQAFLNLLKSGGGSANSVPEPSTFITAAIGMAALYACTVLARRVG